MATQVGNVMAGPPEFACRDLVEVESVADRALLCAERLREAEEAAVRELAALSAGSEDALVRALGSIYGSTQAGSTTAAGAGAAELLHAAILCSRGHS